MTPQIPIKLNTKHFLPLLEGLDGIEDCRLNNNYSECVQRAIFFAYRYAFKKRSDLGGLTTMKYVSEARSPKENWNRTATNHLGSYFSFKYLKSSLSSSIDMW